MKYLQTGFDAKTIEAYLNEEEIALIKADIFVAIESGELDEADIDLGFTVEVTNAIFLKKVDEFMTETEGGEGL